MTDYLPPNYKFTAGWIIFDTAGFSLDDEVNKATVFALGNGYMGSRGAPEGIDAALPGIVGNHINGIYDSPSGGILDREMINLPDWRSMMLEVDGEKLTVEGERVAYYVRRLDMKQAVMEQEIVWETAHGVRITLESERIISLARLHVAAIRWRLRADADCEVVLRSAVDLDVNNRFAESHFANVDIQPEERGGAVRVVTSEEGYVVQMLVRHASSIDAAWKSDTAEQRLETTFRSSLQAGQAITFDKFVSVHDSRFSTGDLVALCRDELDVVSSAGYDKLRADHVRRWAAWWDSSDMVIEGDDEAQIAIRFCIFHLLANAPHSDRVSISARGLQGQDYWGSIFWDCEIYVLPMFIYTQPEYARHCLIYRYHTLDGAIHKAQSLGYRGAYYAWQSQETGDETCALYVFDDPLTGEKIRSYFADEQIHISADVVYALWQYVQASGDETFLRGYGLRIICEVARFFASRVTFNEESGRYELRTVLGPDEYHERIDNNAYTNVLAQWCLSLAVDLLERTEVDYGALMPGLDAAEIGRWREIAGQLYVPEPDFETELIPQFDGYFTLEDVRPSMVRSRLEHPDQYPGGLTGPFQSTQAIKQADVVLLLYLMRSRYEASLKEANWDYYEPRTAHDSSLSPMAYALVAADIDRVEWAYPYFMRTATMDLIGSGPHWNLGVHTAAMGGAWLVVVHGFCRVELREDGVYLLAWPLLPQQWQRVQFSFYWQGHRVRFVSDGQETALQAESGPVRVVHPDGEMELQAEETITLRRKHS